MYGVVNTIVKNPVLHRAKDRLQREQFYKENGRHDVFFDTLIDTGIGDDEWVCDFCNTQIEVGTFDKPTSVYIHGSYALCTNCLYEYKAKYPEEFQVEQTCVCCNEDGYKEFIANKEEEE